MRPAWETFLARKKNLSAAIPRTFGPALFFVANRVNVRLIRGTLFARKWPERIWNRNLSAAIPRRICFWDFLFPVATLSGSYGLRLVYGCDKNSTANKKKRVMRYRRAFVFERFFAPRYRVVGLTWDTLFVRKWRELIWNKKTG